MIIDLEVELTNYCNFRCPLCLRQTRTVKNILISQPILYLQEDILFKYINQHKETLRFITFAGSISEPTMHPKFIDIIKYIVKTYKSIIITIYTNGSAQLKIYKLLAQIFSFYKKKHKIIFTVCGSNQKIHQVYRTGSNLDKIIQAYDICIKYCYVELNWILFNYNFQDYIDNKTIFGNRNLKVFNSIPYHEVLGNEYNSNIYVPSNISINIKKMITKKSNDCSAEKKKFRCISFDGKVYKCNMYRFFSDKYCFLCNTDNISTMLLSNITPPPEPAGEANIFVSNFCIKN